MAIRRIDRRIKSRVQKPVSVPTNDAGDPQRMQKKVVAPCGRTPAVGIGAADRCPNVEQTSRFAH